MNLKSALISLSLFIAVFAFGETRDGIPNYPVDRPSESVNDLANRTLPKSGGDDVFYIDRKNKRVVISTAVITSISVSTITVSSSATFSAPIVVSSNAVSTSTPIANALYGNLIPKAIGFFNANGVLSYSVNVATVTRPATGSYNVRFQIPFTSVNYVCVASRAGNVGDGEATVQTGAAAWSASTAVFRTAGSGGGSDNNPMTFGCWGEQ